MEAHTCKRMIGYEIVKPSAKQSWRLKQYRPIKTDGPTDTVTIQAEGKAPKSVEGRIIYTGDDWKDSGQWDLNHVAVVVVQYCPFCGQKLE